MKNFKEYDACLLCPRMCRAKRNDKETGICKETLDIKIGRASLHLWEEPCISGEKGSGTVFFSGCSLKCIYCQNYALSRSHKGTNITVEELADIFLSLEKDGAHNINLVTAEHFAPSIKNAVIDAKNRGLKLPVILNSSGYVSESTIELLKDVVDIYLVDFKYMDQMLAKEFSAAEDYPKIAREALRKMVNLKGKLVYDENGMLLSGVIVRHLCLPGCSADSKNILSYLYKTYGGKIKLSIMSQYTPMESCKNHPLLFRKLSVKEYDEIIDYALSLGIEDAYIQDGESASESFIPEFS